MKSPPRWKDSPHAAPVGVAELLSSAKASQSIAPAIQAMTAKKVIALSAGASSGIAGLSTIGGGGLASLVGGKMLMTSGAILIGGAAIVGATKVGAWSPRASETRAPSSKSEFQVPAPADAPAKAPTEEGATAAPVVAADSRDDTPMTLKPKAPVKAVVVSEPAHVDVSEVSPASESRAPVVDTIAEEASLIGEARKQLKVSPESAGRTLAEHRARFASGQLARERELLFIEALVRMGRKDESIAARDRFLASETSASYRARALALVE